jgi:hypothetical protein
VLCAVCCVLCAVCCVLCAVCCVRCTVCVKRVEWGCLKRVEWGASTSLTSCGFLIVCDVGSYRLQAFPSFVPYLIIVWLPHMIAREVVWVTIDSAACVSAAFSKLEAPFLSVNPLPGTVRGHYWHMAPGAASGLVRLCGARRFAAAHPPPRYVCCWRGGGAGTGPREGVHPCGCSVRAPDCLHVGDCSRSLTPCPLCMSCAL